jgi:uncharacterized protein YuzE
MKLVIDTEAGAAYISLKTIDRKEVTRTKPIEEDINLDFDRHGRLLGIEILDLKKLPKEATPTLDDPYARIRLLEQGMKMYGDHVGGCPKRPCHCGFHQMWEMITATCPRGCALPLIEGRALRTTLVAGAPDFIGDKSDTRGMTISPGGPGEMVDVWKCPGCGYSRTKDPA